MNKLCHILHEIVTIPLSWLYGLAVFVRNTCYDEHLLPVYTPDIPTIGVGNLAVGGTGKTPHTEYLIALLKDRYTIAVLSRGYGRRSHGFKMADAESTADILGDEMMQMHRRFPEVAMAVCNDRVRGIKILQQRIPGLQVVLLDDAYQHRQLLCGTYVLLTSYDRLYVNDHLMPRGRLREQSRNSLRAQHIVVTKCPPTMRPIDKRIIDNALHLPSFQHLYFSSVQYAMPKLPGTPLIVAGIAHPEYMLDYVRSQYPQAEMITYSDHHRFSRRDIKNITARADNFACVLTTEKDYMRLSTIELPETLREKLFTLPIQVDMKNDTERFDKNILTYINETLRKKDITIKNYPLIK